MKAPLSVDLASLYATRIGVAGCALLIVGCAALDSTPPTRSAPGGAPQGGVAVVAAAPSPTMPAASAAAGAGIAKSSTPGSAASSAPVAKASAKATPSAAPTAAAPAAPALAKPPAAPPLDLASLEKRLRESNAIGVVTKITLKNQVDDLLDQFRAFYQGRLKTTLDALRQPYDRLLLKVLALLQDSDPQLASAISASREAIWGILSDRAKFATI